MANIHTATNRLQVLQVLGNAIVGGMESYVTRLIERLPRDQFGVTVLCPYECPLTDHIRDLGAEVFVTPMPDNPPWSSIQMASALIKSHAIDVLHAHLPNAHLLAGLAGKLAGKPVLTTIHGRQLATLDLEVHRAAGTHLSVVCRQTYFHALGLGVSPSQLHFIANGVDTTQFKPRSAPAHGLRERLGLRKDQRLVAQVGRLSPEKGPDVFIRMALAARQAAPDTHFVLIGDGPLRADMQKLIEQLNLGDHVHLAGVVSDMSQVYSELDMVVSSSRSEAMPLAVMEAMASGLPVVATRVGGVPDLIEHGHTGWLTGDGDFDAIARHVASMVQQPEQLQAMGQRARARIEARFSLTQSVDGMAQLLQKLTQRNTESRRVSPLVSSPKAGAPLNGTSHEPGKAATA